jgi:hypothetical protein
MPVQRRRDPELAQDAAEAPYDTTVDQTAAAHEAVPWTSWRRLRLIMSSRLRISSSDGEARSRAGGR